MKKIGLLLALIAWLVTAVKYITMSFLKDTDVLSAFQTLEYSSVNAKVVAYGTCDVVLDEECKQEYVKKIISELGICLRMTQKLQMTEISQLYIAKKMQIMEVLRLSL